MQVSLPADQDPRKPNLYKNRNARKSGRSADGVFLTFSRWAFLVEDIFDRDAPIRHLDMKV